MDITAILIALFAEYQPLILTLIGLIIADVILGIASALRQGNFSWHKLAEFYLRTVLPGLLGWIGMQFVVKLALTNLPSSINFPIDAAVAYSTYTALVATLAASIMKSLREVTGI